MEKYILCDNILSILRKNGFTTLDKWLLTDIAEQLLGKPSLHIGITGVNYSSVAAFESRLLADPGKLSFQSYTQESLQDEPRPYVYADVWIQFMDIHRPISKSDYELYKTLSDQQYFRPILIVFNDMAHLNEEELLETKVYIEEKMTSFEQPAYGLFYISLSSNDTIHPLLDSLSTVGGRLEEYSTRRYDILVQLLKRDLVIHQAEIKQTENQHLDSTENRDNLVEQIRGIHLFAEGMLAQFSTDINEQQLEGTTSLIRALLRKSPFEFNVTTALLASLDDARTNEELFKTLREYFEMEIKKRRELLRADTGLITDNTHEIKRKITIINELLSEVTTHA